VPNSSASEIAFSFAKLISMFWMAFSSSVFIVLPFMAQSLFRVSVMPRVCSWYRQIADGSTLRFMFFGKLSKTHPSAPHRLQACTPFMRCHLWLPPHRVDHP
jgi:hypothetical protein